jgi:hypothetical protein
MKSGDTPRPGRTNADGLVPIRAVTNPVPAEPQRPRLPFSTKLAWSFLIGLMLAVASYLLMLIALR